MKVSVRHALKRSVIGRQKKPLPFGQGPSATSTLNFVNGIISEL
jgi:hypothetical protein